VGKITSSLLTGAIVVGGFALFWLILFAVVSFGFTIFFPSNQISGSFSSSHTAKFSVNDSPYFEPKLEVRVQYYMRFYEWYTVGVAVWHDSACIADEELEIHSTATKQQTESASITILVPGAGEYSIVFSPEGSKEIDFSISQCKSSEFDSLRSTVSAGAATAVIVVLIVGMAIKDSLSRRKALETATTPS